MTAIRTFIAVDISAASRSRAVELAGELRGSGARASWTRSENLHLTLKFLGDTDERRIPDVCRAVSEAARGHAPFSIHLYGAGAFPNAHRPRTVWLGVREGERAMCDLVEAIETLLAGQGFPKESKKYTPHLTIGRVRESGPGQTELGRRISENAGFDAGTSRIEEVLVVASRLDPKGAEYTVLGRAPLGH